MSGPDPVPALFDPKFHLTMYGGTDGLSITVHGNVFHQERKPRQNSGHIPGLSGWSDHKQYEGHQEDIITALTHFIRLRSRGAKRSRDKKHLQRDRADRRALV